MTLENALAIFAAMPAADQIAVLCNAGIERAVVVHNVCGCSLCRKIRTDFVIAVSARADEIEGMMLNEQKMEGSA
jgi:hypothetical protein